MAVTGNTHTWTLSCKPSGVPSLPADQPTILSAPEAEDIMTTVLAGQVLQVFSGLITVAKVTSFVLHATQVNVTVNTNSPTGAGGQSFPLGADKADGWATFMQGASPLTIDITGIWVDNSAGTKDAVFRSSFLSTV